MQRLRRRVEELLGIRVRRRGRWGHDDCDDIAAAGVPIATVLDVGANVGQSARRFRLAFPRAEIHSFEPLAENFARLEAAVGGDPRTFCHRLAVAATSGRATLYRDPALPTATLAPPARPGPLGEEVETVALDRFAERHRLERVDLLKIDAEGHEREVLAGAAGLFAGERVAFVLVEASFDPGYGELVPLAELARELAGRGFALYGVYDQVPDPGPRPALWHANACFAHDSLARRP